MNENGLHNTLNASTENRLGQIIVSVGSVALLALVGFWAFMQETKGDVTPMTTAETTVVPVPTVISTPEVESIEFEAEQATPVLAKKAVFNPAPTPQMVSQMKWQKLSVVQAQGQATLSWIPESATAIEYIVIERSFDRQQFEAIDTLFITNKDQLVGAQKWTDSITTHGSFPRVSYRLCSYGLDEITHRSAMITIDLGFQEGLYSQQTSIQQNQVDFLVASDSSQDSIKLELVDSYGTPITDTTISAGRQARIIPLMARVQPLNPGDEYFIRLSNQSAQAIHRLRWD